MADLSTSLPNQALVLEFRVFGALDGVTPSPQVVLPPGIAAPGECQTIVVDLDGTDGKSMNLGLVNLAGIGQTPYADRIVRPLLVIGPNVPTGGDNINVVFDGERSEFEHIIPPAANGLFVESCIFVPQAHQLQLQNMVASPGEPIIVRIGIFLPDTVPALAKMREACCCLGSSLNAAGQQTYVTALYSASACSRTVTSVVPTPISRAVGTAVITITGTNFASDDAVAVVNVDGTSLIPVDLITFINDTTLQVTLDVGAADLGFYDVTVAARLAFGTCSATLDAALEITP